MPCIASTFSVEAWIKPELITGICGLPDKPSADTSKPNCSPHHWRASATPTKFAMVAPVTITPLIEAGMPSNCFSQSKACSSIRTPTGDSTQV